MAHNTSWMMETNKENMSDQIGRAIFKYNKDIKNGKRTEMQAMADLMMEKNRIDYEFYERPAGKPTIFSGGMKTALK